MTASTKPAEILRRQQGRGTAPDEDRRDCGRSRPQGTDRKVQLGDRGVDVARPAGARRCAKLGSRVGVEVAVAASRRAERYVQVIPNGRLPNPSSADSGSIPSAGTGSPAGRADGTCLRYAPRAPATYCARPLFRFRLAYVARASDPGTRRAGRLPRLAIMAARVLVVEDDPTMAEVLLAYLAAPATRSPGQRTGRRPPRSGSARCPTW